MPGSYKKGLIFTLLHRAFTLLHRAFILLHRAFTLLHRAFTLLHRAFTLLHRAFILLHRAFILCCGWNKFHTEVCFLKDISRKNLFPKNFTDYCIKVLFNKIFTPKQIITTVPKKEVRICLPFLGKYSFEIRSKLKQFVNSHFPQCKLQVTFNSNNRLRSFKDKIVIILKLHV